MVEVDVFTVFQTSRSGVHTVRITHASEGTCVAVGGERLGFDNTVEQTLPNGIR